MHKTILIRFGDLMIKGKNIGFFLKKIRTHIQQRCQNLTLKMTFTHDRIFMDYLPENEDALISEIQRVPGIFNFSIIHVTKPQLDDIIQCAISVLDQETYKDNLRFKIESVRTDKSFPMTSLEITQKIASPILSQAKHTYIVDVKHPEEILTVDIRKDFAYVYMRKIAGMGGFPFGTQGKGLLMMSGGIDSPVAGYQVMKQGMEIELIHFESTPLTPLESIQKVIDLAKKIARFTPKGIIKLHIVPFSAIHQDILKEIPDPYIITVLRRMMYRIAEAYAKRIKIFSIINGESLGQVASQTIQSIQVVEAVTKLPIIRPLITWDKQDIINLSKKIDTYDISIRPFNDCCSIYVPKAPVTKPMELYANRYEKYLHFNDQNLHEMLEKVYTLTIHESDEINLADHGFTFEEVYPMLTKKEE